MSTETTTARSSTSTSSPARDLAAAASALSRHAQNPSAFLALNRDTRWFTVPGIDGLIAYRPAGRGHLVQFGGVFADPAQQADLFRAFGAVARRGRRRIIGVQLTRADAAFYAANGFTVNQLGAEYARSLAGFSLAGKKHMQLRNKISRARRAGVVVVEVGVDRPSTPELDRQLLAIDRDWLRSKGRHVKELSFMVGERGGDAGTLRRLFVALDAGGAVLGYVSFAPAYGDRSGWLHDLSRRSPDAPPGVLELIVATSVERFRGEGAAYLHFGLTPFTGLAPDYDQPGYSPVARWILRQLATRGSALYPATDQLAYKHKWGPDVIEPAYIAFQGRVGVRAVWSLLRLTNAA